MSVEEKSQILESEILVLCESVLQETFHQYIRYYNIIIFDWDMTIWNTQVLGWDFMSPLYPFVIEPAW
jgi:hypothetical protein